MNRRQFLRTAALGIPAVLAPTALLEAIAPKRTIFLPPSDGWPQADGYLRIYGGEAILTWDHGEDQVAGPFWYWGRNGSLVYAADVVYYRGAQARLEDWSAAVLA